MKNFFTADTHYYHENILKYCPGRPYRSLEDMHSDFIARWNARVKNDDTVYHLGDFGFGPVERLRPIVAALRGRKVLVLGNHDRGVAAMLALGFSKVTKEIFVTDSLSSHVRLRHHPGKETGGGDSLYLCGHVHERWRRGRVWVDTVVIADNKGIPRTKKVIRSCADPRGLHFNVGVDARDFRPVTLEEVYYDDKLPLL